jgi:amidohydrolase
LSKIEGVEVDQPIPQLPSAIIATITPEKYETTILLRCELDALSFPEQSCLPFSSDNGLHHACGHDGHMAAMISTIKIVARERAELRKRILFCFQPGEEGKRGAYKLFNTRPSLMEAVNHCYALHFHNAIRPGQVKIDSGPVTALSNRFAIAIKGRPAHCLAPHGGVDANYLGCTLVSQLYALSAQTIAPMEGSSLVIYKVEGGSSVVKVSDNFEVVGSLRTFSVKSY